MEFTGSQITDLTHQNLDKSDLFKESIFKDKVRLLYAHNPFSMTIQIVASFSLILALWDFSSHKLLSAWLMYMLLLSGSWIIITAFHWYKADKLNPRYWLSIFALLTFLSGAGWGIAGSILIPSGDIIHQSFVIILLVSIASGSLPFLSSFIFIYGLFLLPEFVPFVTWLFLQGGTYVFLGFCGLIYVPVIFISCCIINNFLVKSLVLQYKNTNLDLINHILEQKISERTSELERSLAITQSTLESTVDGILVLGLQGQIEYFNQQFITMFEQINLLSPNMNNHTVIEEIVTKISLPEKFLQIMAQLKENPEQAYFDEITLKNGKIYEWYSRPHKISNFTRGRVWGFRDISLKKEMELQLTYQANHDMLTALPNRTLLNDRIEQGIAQVNRYHSKLAVMLLDIDNFKLINDNLGHNAGDILLQKIAQALLHCTRKGDTVARLGGDEFVVLFMIKREEDLNLIAQKILSAVTKPIQLTNYELVVTTSIGISVYPKDGNDTASLLKTADMAMYLAKAQGRNNFKLYDNTIQLHTQKSLEMQIELRNALANNEFFLVYQPTIDLQTNHMIAVEALVRWKHPKKGIIHPIEFISIAEESNIIVLLGEWIFRRACLQNKMWQEEGLRPIRMAINVSGVQLLRDSFVNMVELALSDAQLDSKYIEIELTESTIMDDKKQNLDTLIHLQKQGINLTVDDFGTGYSCLNYLKQFPVYKLKIDQSFVHNCTTDANDASIVQAIIAMGHSLQLKVLAEGIETEEQLHFLRDNHCDEGQGYFFDKPLTAKKVAQRLADEKSSNSQFADR